MSRWLTWIADQHRQGWACSRCAWSFSVPALLTDADAKSAYDRLASARFAEHDCAKYGQRTNQSAPNTFAQQVRNLIIRGFKPKDAVDITLQEIMFEHRDNPELIEKAQVDAADFLRRVKGGLI